MYVYKEPLDYLTAFFIPFKYLILINFDIMIKNYKIIEKLLIGFLKNETNESD